MNLHQWTLSEIKKGRLFFTNLILYNNTFFPCRRLEMSSTIDQSSKIKNLSPEWKNWIQENLARSCSINSLIEILIKNNFESAFAGLCVYQLANSNNAKSEKEYVYETPRLPQSGNIIKACDRDVFVSFRLNRPVVAMFDNLLSYNECDELIALSRAKLERSTVVDPITGERQVIEARSSYGTYFSLNENPFIVTLDRRIASVMHWPIENGEGIQILNYKVGAEYKPHYDYFSVGDPGNAIHLARGGQRVSTLVMYLNDVEGAGETIFPTIGLSVTPKKGSALYFEYCNSKGQIDPLTLHGGGPVSAGEKWIATKWMRQNRYQI